MSTKLHPSIVISSRAKSTVYVAGECKLFQVSEDEAYSYATEVSDELWLIEVAATPAKPRPTRIWDEAGWA